MDRKIDLTENNDFRKEKININSHMNNFINLDKAKRNDNGSMFLSECITMYSNTITRTIHFSNGFEKEFNPFEKNYDIPQHICYRCGTVLNGLIENNEDSLCKKCNELLSIEYNDTDKFLNKENKIINDDFIKFERMIWW